MKNLLLALSVWLSLCCAVSAQLPNGGQPAVPDGGGSSVQANLNAAADPTANNDQTQGYAVGSIWQNSNTGRVFIARSVGTGAAVWDVLAPQQFPGYIAANWYMPAPYQGTATSSASVANNIRCYPGFLFNRVTLNNVAIRVISGTAGNIQAAIYANNASAGQPTGNPLVASASMAITAPGIVSTSVTATQFEAGMYWFCTNTDTAANTFTTFNTSTTGPMGYLIGNATNSNVLGGGSGALTGIQYGASTFGTWPNLTSIAPTFLVAGNGFAGFAFEVQSIP